MRSLSLLCLLASAGLALVSAAPAANVCSPNQVQLELRPLGVGVQRTPTGMLAEYQLAFVKLDQPMLGAGTTDNTDFIDIHYRVNNEDSVNLRVLTKAAIAGNQIAKQAQVDGIQLEGGDVIRAYATYSANGIACDTPIHTFNAPHQQQQQESMPMLNRQQQSLGLGQFQQNPRIVNRRQQQQMQDVDLNVQAMYPPMRRASEEDRFWAQAAVEAESNTMQGACPGIALEQDVLRQQGVQDSFVLSFENKTPARQLHYVDLHVSNDGIEWDNLRLASDMQLNLAHKVMQPGVVIQPNEQLAWYWSYRTSAADGSTVDCSTPIESITAQEVTEEVNLNQLNIQ